VTTLALANRTAGGLVNTTPSVNPPALDVVARDFFLNSAATTNMTLVQVGPRAVGSLYASNTGAAVAYVKLYNKATVPLTTDIPVMIIPLQPLTAGMPGVAQIMQSATGFRFPLGLGIAITGGIADNDATAVAAGQVKVFLTHKA
jgi:hypothetical protein